MKDEICHTRCALCDVSIDVPLGCYPACERHGRAVESLAVLRMHGMFVDPPRPRRTKRCYLCGVRLEDQYQRWPACPQHHQAVVSLLKLKGEVITWEQTDHYTGLFAPRGML